MCLLGVFVSLIMVTHVVLFGCVEMVTCCLVMMPRGIHMRLFCHYCSLPFLGNGSPNQYDGTVPRRVIRSLRHPPHTASTFIHPFNKRRLTFYGERCLFTQTEGRATEIRICR